MECLGYEPKAVELKAQPNPLSWYWRLSEV